MSPTIFLKGHLSFKLARKWGATTLVPAEAEKNTSIAAESEIIPCHQPEKQGEVFFENQTIFRPVPRC